MSDKAGNKLIPNSEQWVIFNIINSAKLDGKLFIAWKFVGKQKITVEIEIVMIRKFRDEFKIKAVGANQKNLKEIFSGCETVNIYAPDDLVLFQSQIKYADPDGGYLVTFPKMIAQVERRRFLRLFVTDHLQIFVNFLKKGHGVRRGIQSFEKKCFDVSAGGLSFIVSSIESRYFAVGDDLYGMELLIDNQSYLINGKIVNILEMKPNERNQLAYKGTKVCIKYTEVEVIAVKHINDYVFRHSDIEAA
jgi:c-di-GMP-binding flagellar brake protein YcgR